jgi:hypothetical protein
MHVADIKMYSNNLFNDGDVLADEPLIPGHSAAQLGLAAGEDDAVVRLSVHTPAAPSSTSSCPPAASFASTPGYTPAPPQGSPSSPSRIQQQRSVLAQVRGGEPHARYATALNNCCPAL